MGPVVITYTDHTVPEIFNDKCQGATEKKKIALHRSQQLK
jgi:hypothetical protein